MNKKSISIILLFHFFCCIIQAQQNPQPSFRNYSTEDGLPSPEVYCAFEDSKGYMWFGTDNGATRFDGYEFKNYGANEGLMSNVVFDIHEDKKGRIWFGTMTGEAFILEGDTILPYRYNYLPQQYKADYENAGLVYLSPNETTYFELVRLGYLKIDSTGKEQLITPEEYNSFLILEVTEAPKIFQTHGKAKEYDKGLNKKRFDDYYHMEIASEERKIKKRLKRTVASYWHSAIKLKGTKQYLVYQFNNLILLDYDGNVKWTIPLSIQTSEIIEDDQDYIWICAVGGQGLRRYKNLSALKNNHYDQYLKGISVSNLVFDSKGDAWITTLKNGVYYCTDWQLLTYNPQPGFLENFISTVAFKNNHEIFVEFDNGDLIELNLEDNNIRKIGAIDLNLNNPSLFYDPKKNKLWGGAYYYKNNKKNVLYHRKEISNQLTQYPQLNFENLMANSKRHLIGSTGPTGFHIIDMDADTIIYTSNWNKQRNRVYGLYSDHANRLWIGGTNGIFEFKDSSLIHPDIPHHAFHHRVEDIDEMPDSTLVFGTKGFGVIFWKGDSILQVTDKEGLTSNMLEDVHVDENGICWAGTMNGLNKITFTENGQPFVRVFTMSNGLPSNEIYQIKSYEKQLWLCTAGGLVKFNERPEVSESSAPIFLQVKVNSEAIEIMNNHTFEYKNNNFEFNFLTINYRLDGRIPYRYRLSKAANWQYTQNLSVNYPALPSGSYVFEVQAQNEDRYWSESTAYSFSLLPPWWQTWWARGMAFLAILAVIYYYQKTQSEKIKKEAAIKEQISELERSALQAQMNPHFIFNCLNSIQNFILQNDRKKAVEYLSKFAQLVRHNLDGSVKGEITLVEEIKLLENYLALEQQRFDHKFNYEIKVDEQLNKQLIEFPPLLIQPFVENAVIHGMSEKDNFGKISIQFKLIKNYLEVEIADNGKGVNKSENRNNSIIKHKSHGMGITQKRLELFNSVNKNPVEIKTIKNKEGKPEGTKVSILIKLKKTVHD